MGCQCSKSDAYVEPPKNKRKPGDGTAIGGGFSNANIIFDNDGNLSDFYNIDKRRLGEGSFGSVYKATHKATGAARAVKSICKDHLHDWKRFKQENAIMKMMDHPNIIKLYESFEDYKNIYLVMELCVGGELFDRIIDAGHFTEVQAAILMQQIVLAVYYMHDSKFCHRDLKPENFMFVAETPIEKSLLKIIDFGMSCSFAQRPIMTTRCSSPFYVAPEVLAGRYDHLCDMWSCGAIVYLMLCGYPPFWAETDAGVLSKVRTGSFSFRKSDWKNISDDAKSLIKMLLKMEPHERYSAEQALNHEWLAQRAPKATGVALESCLMDNLRSFRSQTKLKKVALHIIANQLDENAIKPLRETFMSLDANGDGKLTLAEVKEGIEKAGLKDIPQDLQQIMEEIDSDRSGVIDYSEFLAAALDRREYLREDVCWSAFQVFDRNGDGKISRDELEQVLGDDSVESLCGASAIEALMKEVDVNGDGTIDFQEFMQMMKFVNADSHPAKS